MKIQLFFIIAFVLSCTGCLAKIECNGDYAYDPADFTEEQQEWIENSASRWNNWVGYRLIKVSPGNRNSCIIRNGITSDPSKIGQDSHPKEVILVNLERLSNLNHLDQAHVEAVVMHELGHSLGYDHIENGKALMAPVGALDFTDLDRVECIKHNMCDTLEPPSN